MEMSTNLVPLHLSSGKMWQNNIFLNHTMLTYSLFCCHLLSFMLTMQCVNNAIICVMHPRSKKQDIAGWNYLGYFQCMLPHKVEQVALQWLFQPISWYSLQPLQLISIFKWVAVSALNLWQYVSVNLVSFGSDCGLSPVRRQAIT